MTDDEDDDREEEAQERALHAAQYRWRNQQRATNQFEAAKVTLLLRQFNFRVSQTVAQLREHARQQTGDGELTFASFNAVFSSFPFLLGTDRLDGVKLHTDPKSLLPAILQRFTKTPFAKAYAVFRENNLRYAHGRSLGLIFPRKGIKNGLIAYATSHVASLPFAADEAAIICNQGDDTNNVLVIRSYKKWLAAVFATGWREN